MKKRAEQQRQEQADQQALPGTGEGGRAGRDAPRHLLHVTGDGWEYVMIGVAILAAAVTGAAVAAGRLVYG